MALCGGATPIYMLKNAKRAPFDLRQRFAWSRSRTPRVHHIAEVAALTPCAVGNEEGTPPRAGRFVSRAVVGVKSSDVAHATVRNHEVGP
jgi:hypothetical protein